MFFKIWSKGGTFETALFPWKSGEDTHLQKVSLETFVQFLHFDFLNPKILYPSFLWLSYLEVVWVKSGAWEGRGRKRERNILIYYYLPPFYIISKFSQRFIPIFCIHWYRSSQAYVSTQSTWNILEGVSVGSVLI